MAGDKVEKPAVLIIGGLGYIGRFLALHIHTNDLASEVRLVDKQLPELAFLPPEFKDACSRDKFMQADASREQSLTKIFTRAAPNAAKPYTYVINCGGETRFSQPKEVYSARSTLLSLALARHTAAHSPSSIYIECSTGQVYAPSRKPPRRETDPLKPWSKLAKAKAEAEEQLSKIEGLKLVILRLANVYGEYSRGFLGTACALARVYQSKGEEMKWLWDKELAVNTVWVVDAARAILHACEWYVRTRQSGSHIFNIVDSGATNQGTLARLVAAHFDIPTGFQNTMVNTFARMNLHSVTDDVNDSVLDPWAELQGKKGIKPGPISPFVEKELLRDNDLSLDGGKFEKETKFGYQRPKGLDERGVREAVESYERMGWWP
ncbi:MAG: hypothetical protein M1828_005339 [Chrysothrix sp. TS-e1954]|nr:MAG: hypothetical protein M1828_005339 [Chrysothrix sp. TS-e1954]